MHGSLQCLAVSEIFLSNKRSIETYIILKHDLFHATNIIQHLINNNKRQDVHTVIFNKNLCLFNKIKHTKLILFIIRSSIETKTQFKKFFVFIQVNIISTLKQLQFLFLQRSVLDFCLFD